MEYDVYYSTGGGSLIGGGADVWVNHWIENVAPKLKVFPLAASYISPVNINPVILLF